MIEGKNRCPNCGAPLSGLELKCPECGYVLAQETRASQDTTDSILSLQDKIAAVDKVFSAGRASKKKASIINAFPIPNTTESLVRLLHLSYSNFEASKESGDKKLSMAWLGKAVESYRRLSEDKDNPSVATALEQYKPLGDKKVFSKLSGSYKKKRVALLTALAVLALAIAFAFWFDWTGYLLKKGKIDEVVRLYQKNGKTDVIVERLIQSNMFEKAANIMYANGQAIEAVSLLSQKGCLLEALIMTSKVNSPDSIHYCVDRIEDYYDLLNRTKVLPSKRLRIRDNEIIETYNDNKFSIKKIVDSKDTSIIKWEDVWRINDSFDFPSQTHSYSPFQEFYRDKNWKGYPLPYMVNGVFGLSFIRFEEERIKDYFPYCFPYSFEFRFYSASSGRVRTFWELVNYDRLRLCDVIYEFDSTGVLLTKVIKQCRLEDYLSGSFNSPAEEEYFNSNKDNIIRAAELLGLYSKSFTDSYSYEDGRLVSIITTAHYDQNHNRVDKPYFKTYFHRYNNMIIKERIVINQDTGEETINSEKQFYIYSNGELVEDFLINAEFESGL